MFYRLAKLAALTSLAVGAFPAVPVAVSAATV